MTGAAPETGLGLPAHRAARAVVRLLPHAAARWAGGRLGDLGYALDRHRRRRALVEIAAAFPDLGRADCRRLARRSFRRCGVAAAEAWPAARFDLVELCRRLTLEGWDHLQTAASAGRGVLVLTADLGSWEIATRAVGTYAGPLHDAGLPLASLRLAAESPGASGRSGVSGRGETSATRELAAALEAGETAMAVIARPPPPGADRIVVPFFSRPLEVSPVPARLALVHGTPAVLVFALPVPGGRYRVVVRPAIHPPDFNTAARGSGAADPAAATEPPRGEPEAAEVAALTGRYLAALEAAVLRRPEFWPWGAR